MKQSLSLVMAIALAMGTAGGVMGAANYAANPDESVVAYAEEGLTLASFESEENLFADTTDLLDTYEVTTGTMYPADWGMRFAKVDAGYYTRVDNNKTPNTASGSHTATYLPTSKNISEVERYFVSADIKVGDRKDWGGLGIVFGQDASGKPVGFWYGVDSHTLYMASAGNEFAGVMGSENDAVVNVGDTMTMSVIVEGQSVSAFINGNQIGATYTFAEDFAFEPKVGAEVKQYMNEYTNFQFKTVDKILPNFTEQENLFVDTIGLLDTYEVTTGVAYPGDWGIKFAKTAAGYYTRMNNAMEENAPSGSHTASYLATSKDISEVDTYFVSADIKVGERRDWGGLGIVFGQDANGDSVGMWYGVDSHTLYLATGKNEFASVFGGENDAVVNVGDTMTMSVIVEGQSVSAFINGTQIGATYTFADDFVFEPKIGAEVKQYLSEYTNFQFKTLETDLEAAEYTVTCLSGAVEIGTFTYTCGTGVELTEIAKAGYKFMGWHLLPDLSDATIENVDATTGGDITIYCEYIIENYTITYYDGETEVENEDWTYSFTFRDYIALPEMEKEGYTFDGWYLNADFTGEAVEAIEMNTMNDVSLYAKFTKIEDNSSVDSPVDGSAPTTGNSGSSSKSGCSSSLAMMSSVMTVLAMGAVVFTKKRK